MRVALFVPCYIDQFYPEVARATLELLERLGCRVAVPRGQTCCGQPTANAGFGRASAAASRHVLRLFSSAPYVVAPSGSCVLHIREHLAHGVPPADAEAARALAGRTFELCEFLTDVLNIDDVGATFSHRVGLHAGCHGLRGLRLAASSERRDPPFDKVRRLLANVRGLTLTGLDRRDECCGFGGTFAVTEEAVSVRMGRDRVGDHERHGAEVITSTDMSCLMHLDGLVRREGWGVRVLHVAQILNARPRDVVFNTTLNE